MKNSKTQQALALVDGGLTPYAAAKQIGIAAVTVYKALHAREDKQARKLCPTCHQPIKRNPEKE